MTEDTSDADGIDPSWLQYWVTTRETIHGLDEAIQRFEADIYTSMALIVTIALTLLAVLLQFSTARSVYYVAPLMSVAIGVAGLAIIRSISHRLDLLFQVQKGAIGVGEKIEELMFRQSLRDVVGLTRVIDLALPIAAQERALALSRRFHYAIFSSLVAIGGALLIVFGYLGLL